MALGNYTEYSLLWTRKNKHIFPRGGLRLYPVTEAKRHEPFFESWEEIDAFTRYKKDVFVNIFSEDQKRSKMFDVVFLDIDDADVSVAFEKTIEILKALQDNGVVHYHCVYSGSKGFHIYIPMKDVFLRDYRYAVTEWLRKLKVLKLVDTNCLEPNRVSRLIGTVNAKSNTHCTYLGNEIDFELYTLEFMLDLAVQGHNVDMKEWVENDMSFLKRCDRVIQPSKAVSGKLVKKSVMWPLLKHYPPCMEALIVEATIGTDLGHFERLEMGKFLLHIYAGDVDKVIPFYRKMSDFDPAKTRYQLEYVKEKKLKMCGCKRLIDDGICPFVDRVTAKEECAYYPSLNVAMRKDRELRKE